MEPTLSVIFFSYNRTGYLDHALARFLATCSFPRAQMEIIICDDGSQDPHQSMLPLVAARHGVDRLLQLPHRGPGASFNAGIRAARGQYLLHLEDDWALARDAMFVQASLALLAARPNLAAVRLFKLRAFNMDTETRLVETPTDLGPVRSLRLSGNFNVYSNNPHLKPRRFHEEFGYYLEDASGPDTERDFCRRFLAQTHWEIHLLGVCFEHFGRVSTNQVVWQDAAEGIPLLYRPA